MGLTADNNVKISPQGYQITDAPENQNPFWDTGEKPETDSYVKDLSLTQNGNTYTLTATMGDGSQKEIGTFETGSGGGGSTPENAVTGITMTKENGIYTFSYTTGGGASHEIGTVEVPAVNIDNLIAEVNDAIVENTNSGYDFHTLTETEHNGTRNNVGEFYLARKQITDISKSGNNLNIQTVDQTGKMDSKAIPLPEGGGTGGGVSSVDATATVDDTTGTPAVNVTNVGTDTAPVFDFAFSGLKGETGATGAQGPAGEQGPAGVTPDISASAHVDLSTGTPSVAVEKGGTPLKPSFTFWFSGLKGERGADGTGGGVSSVDATATVDDTTGTPAVNVTNVGTDTAPVFDFAFSGLKGETGATGPQGPAGEQGPAGVTPDITINATAGTATGVPGVDVTKSGTAEAPVFDLYFNGIKGEQGDTGPTPVLSAIASVDDTTGTPAVTVTREGNDLYPRFNFAFTGLKGEPGSGGTGGGAVNRIYTDSSVITTIENTVRGVSFTIGVTIDGESKQEEVCVVLNGAALPSYSSSAGKVFYITSCNIFGGKVLCDIYFIIIGSTPRVAFGAYLTSTSAISDGTMAFGEKYS